MRLAEEKKKEAKTRPLRMRSNVPQDLESENWGGKRVEYHNGRMGKGQCNREYFVQEKGEAERISHSEG